MIHGQVSGCLFSQCDCYWLNGQPCCYWLNGNLVVFECVFYFMQKCSFSEPKHMGAESRREKVSLRETVSHPMLTVHPPSHLRGNIWTCMYETGFLNFMKKAWPERCISEWVLLERFQVTSTPELKRQIPKLCSIESTTTLSRILCHIQAYEDWKYFLCSGITERCGIISEHNFGLQLCMISVISWGEKVHTKMPEGGQLGEIIKK